MKFAHAILLACLLPACSSTEPNADPNGLDRPMSERLKKWDPNRKSPFDKQFNLGKEGGSNMAGSLGSKSFHTSNFGGNKSFSGMKNYSAKDFAQGKKGSRYATQSSRFAQQNSRDASTSFTANDSRLGSQSASQGDQTFRNANQAFGTGDYQAGAKSLKKNNRPVIIEGELEAGAKTNYTEAEIRQMVNR